MTPMTPEELGEFLFKHHEHPLAYLDESHDQYSEKIWYPESAVVELLSKLGLSINWSWHEAATAPALPESGIVRITRERTEQLIKHGFSPEQDARYKDDDLEIFASWCLGQEDNGNWQWEYLVEDNHGPRIDPAYMNRINEKPYIERIAIAGALCAAAIDRKQYIDSLPKPASDE